ncbi:MAG: hypothetical protein OHK0053_34990 [Microscillaceae bacterium]
MAQFIAFDPNVEVNGQTVMTIIRSFPEYMNKIGQELLANNGLQEIHTQGWYSQQRWLNTFREISLKFGPYTLFAIGKNIPQNAQFPANISTLEDALNAIDVAYQMNHRLGNIGYYRLRSFSATSGMAVMECHNPYPCDFDRGIIAAMARRFGKQSNLEVKADLHKPCRAFGADSSTYLVTWKP